MLATKSFTGFMALVMLAILGLAALTLLVQVDTAAVVWQSQPVAQKASVDWLPPDQVHVPSGLSISAHSAKHNGDTERIYKYLLEGRCAEAAKFCGGSKAEMMYACVDPLTGLVGIMLQFGNEVTTGYFSRNSNNLRNRISRENWEVCR